MAWTARLLSSICHTSPFLSGCGTLANTSFFRRVAGNRTGMVEARLRGGLRVLTPVNDYVGRALYFFGDLDPKLTWICDHVLRQGDTVLDIGANVGLISLVSALRTGPTGQVHAFEPQPELTRLLGRSLALNELSNVTVHDCALGSRDFEGAMNVPQDNRGSASLVRDTSDGRSVPIRVRAASDFLRELDLGPIRLMKLDVEGYEAEVLEGARSYLETNRPEFIMLELNEASIPFREQPAIEILRSLGFQFAGIPRSFLRMTLRPLSGKYEGTNYGHDVLAMGSHEAFDLLRDRMR